MFAVDTLTRHARPAAILGGFGMLAAFGVLTAADTGTLESLDWIEKHWLFHIIQAPIYGALAIALLALRRAHHSKIGRLGRFGSGLALFGFGVGVIAGAIIPFVELVLGINTEEGALDILVHMPEFMPYVIGSGLFGVALFRSRVVSRDRAIMLALGAILMFFIGAFGQSLAKLVPLTIYSLAWVRIGTAIPAAPRVTTTRTALAS